MVGNDFSKLGERMRRQTLGATAAATIAGVGVNVVLIFLGAAGFADEHRALAALALVGLGVFLATACGMLVDRSFLRPMRRLAEGIERMAEGDLSARVDSAATGYFAPIAHALNEMWSQFGGVADRVLEITGRVQTVTERLAHDMDEIRDGSESQTEAVEHTSTLLTSVDESIRTLNSEIESLSASTEATSSSVLEMGASVEEVARSVGSLNEAVESSSSSSQEMGASIRQVAESADEVQRMAEETAASMSQMDRAIQEVGDHVRGASELTERVSTGAQDGTAAVNATIEGIEEIRSQTRQAKEVLERLVGRIGEIGEILTVMGEINDETNLLSLNAAIIAAQAGEQGKAFAVVANHVKTLAKRTAMSTQEIGRLIHSVQDESTNAVAAMDAGIGSVETGVERSRKAGDALESIRTLAADANSRVSEIMRAAQEQERNSTHVSEAANRTSTMVQKISSAMAEQSRASDQTLQTSETALNVCRQVSRSSDEQRETTNFITQSVTDISEMMRAMQRKLSDHAEASRAVSETVMRVLDVARKTGDVAPSLSAAAAELRREASELADEVGRFRTHGDRSHGDGQMRPTPAGDGDDAPTSATHSPA